MLLASLALPWSTAVCAQSSRPPYLLSNFYWVDATRARAVPARLYWPTTPVTEGSVPLIVFSHGIGGSRQGYSYLGKYWSTHGVASLHVQHVGSDAALWRGNPFGIVGRLQSAAQETEAIARAADMRFALDQLLESSAHGTVVDRRRIVAAGHSYGANTTLLTVGAQVVRGGQIVDCRDQRFTAAIVLSAPPFYGEADLAAVLRPIAVPTLHVTATDDVIHIPGYHSGIADRLAVFNAIAHPHKLLTVFQDGSHSIFTDRPFTGGPSLNAKVKIATAELAMAFLELVFEQNSAALLQWQARWGAILAQMSADESLPLQPLQGFPRFAAVL